MTLGIVFCDPFHRRADVKFVSSPCIQKSFKMVQDTLLTLTYEVACQRSEIFRVLMSKVYCKSACFWWKGKCLIQSIQYIGTHLMFP
jgi:hypothetical protein